MDRFKLLLKLLKMPSSTVAKKHCADLTAETHVSTSNPAGTAFLKFVKISDKAQTPSKGSPLAAGYDLYSAADVVSSSLFSLILEHFFAFLL